jgi:hypothetical protein
MYCNHCGKPISGNFCNNCGTKSTKPVKKASQTPTVCQNCNHSCFGNFCPNCGTPIGRPQQPARQPVRQAVPMQQRAPKKKKRGCLGKALMALLVVAVLLFALVWLFGDEEEEDAPDSALSISEQEFREQCDSDIPYEELIQDPQPYIGQNYTIELCVSQVITGNRGAIFYRCNADGSGSNWDGDEYYIADFRTDGEALSVGDIFQCYGTFTSVQIITRKASELYDELPKIDMYYCDLK